MIQCKDEICGDLEAALRREWLETNGIGGFASSTIIGMNTRRYHGLLVAATKPPVGRFLLLAKLEETLFIGGEPFELATNRFPGVVHPEGFRYLKQFRLDPFPVFTYEVDGIEIEKTVFMIHGENSTVIHYEVKKNNHLQSQRELRLALRPLIAFRDYHSTTHENAAIDTRVEVRHGLASVAPYLGLPAMHLAHNAIELKEKGEWYRNFEYDAERERGLDFVEDLFNPFELSFDLRRRRQASLIASVEPRDSARVIEYRQAEITRRRVAAKSSPVEDDFAQSLAEATDQFIVCREKQKTVIAGYHWFSDWGRDTMIALPGLTLVTGKYEVARSILRTFAQHVDQGILPSRFPDAGEKPEYNTVDATLWFFEAARALLSYTGDLEFIRTELYPVFVDIIEWHRRGTHYGIKVDACGLLNSGAAGVQLTWMDAKIGDWVVTPRSGKPVEIQALWYNALRLMEDLARQFGDKPRQKRYGDMATLAEREFNRIFWNQETGCLYDVVGEGPPDRSIRPNQILAISLNHGMLSPERARSVVDIVQHHLLTPYGLRSLAPSDPQYQNRYTGNPVSRDAAYHQGTVWPWLMGPFIRAHIKVYGNGDVVRRQAAQWLTPLKDYVADVGLGQIAEIFDGDAPQYPRGCMAQAWSVAEIFRTLVEDIYGHVPTRYPSFGRSPSQLAVQSKS